MAQMNRTYRALVRTAVAFKAVIVVAQMEELVTEEAGWQIYADINDLLEHAHGRWEGLRRVSFEDAR